MYVQPQERQLFGIGGLLGADTFGLGNDGAPDGGVSDSGLGAIGSDGISRLIPPSLSSDGTIGGLPAAMPLLGIGAGIGPILQSVFGMLRQLGQMLGVGVSQYAGGNQYAGGSQCAGANQTYFQSASGSSTGDPHLDFNGRRWDSMTDHANLLNSDSFNGGLRIATQVTAPNANGVTMNGQAGVFTDNGQTGVTLDNEGNAALVRYGQSTAISDGQTFDLGNGETVARDADGTLHVVGDNGAGGRVATILRDSGGGVDVSAQASNVDLGGDLVNGNSRVSKPPHNHWRHPLPVYQRAPDDYQAVTGARV